MNIKKNMWDYCERKLKNVQHWCVETASQVELWLIGHYTIVNQS